MLLQVRIVHLGVLFCCACVISGCDYNKLLDCTYGMPEISRLVEKHLYHNKCQLKSLCMFRDKSQACFENLRRNDKSCVGTPHYDALVSLLSATAQLEGGKPCQKQCEEYGKEESKTRICRDEAEAEIPKTKAKPKKSCNMKLMFKLCGWRLQRMVKSGLPISCKPEAVCHLRIKTLACIRRFRGYCSGDQVFDSITGLLDVVALHVGNKCYRDNNCKNYGRQKYEKCQKAT